MQFPDNHAKPAAFNDLFVGGGNFPSLGTSCTTLSAFQHHVPSPFLQVQ
jgi:hypothetical protein